MGVAEGHMPQVVPVIIDGSVPEHGGYRVFGGVRLHFELQIGPLQRVVLRI